MSSQCFNGGLIALWLLLSCRTGLAVAVGAPAAGTSTTPAAAASGSPAPASTSPTTIYLQPQNPALINQPDMPTPAMMALPADTSTSDASLHRKFYTLTASLREVYDTNVGTASSNAQSTLETDLSPSVLVDFPDNNGDFSARYTLGIIYYDQSAQNNSNAGGSTNTQQLQLTHEFVAQYSHTFSERYSLNAAESFRYFIEPNILQSTGTNYQNGPYTANTINGTFTAQLSPLLSSTASYSNAIVRYQDSIVGAQQNSLENIGSAGIGYSVLPKLAANVGFILDDLSYETADRGYTTYTGYAGATWEALPTLSFVGRGGVTYIEPVQNQTPGAPPSTATFAPYAALSMSWTLGARSSLVLSYAHEITPSDEADTNGQVSDRFNANFNYQITTRLSSYLSGAFTSSTYSGALGSAGISENAYEFDLGLTYAYNSFLNLNTGVTISGVQSNNDNDNYTRDEVYVGVRGTY